MTAHDPQVREDCSPYVFLTRHYDEVLKNCQDLLDRRYEINRPGATAFRESSDVWIAKEGSQWDITDNTQ